ncbi:alpha/beta fold hydrolase [Luteimonas sp. R10]|uniref:alpha/beta hydrolase family protein n=1 Tax=Luteimonas sp. R10 TaxID=3108176 RepID=UPI003093C372|nr:alpha/beta fold hydrolase [Luteimonas sp. R10]
MHETPLQADDGHCWSLQARLPARPRASLLWLPALGVTARNYLPFAEALAAQGIAVFLHEWRGFGSSNLRASRENDWGYRALLTRDLPASEAAIAQALPGVERLIGGHSLGGQLACCRLALRPQAAQRLWLVASGAPYWRAFPRPQRLWLPLAYRFLPWLAGRRGSLPGRTIGFGGNEARGVIGDWARTALSGRYGAAGLDVDLEAALSRVAVPVQAIVLRDDWLCPASSLRFLLSKLGPAQRLITSMDAGDLQVRADHFAWLRQPEEIARKLVGDLSIERG